MAWVPHIWRAFCARYGKPQISPLRFAPVEMTNKMELHQAGLLYSHLLFFLSFPQGICFWKGRRHSP